MTKKKNNDTRAQKKILLIEDEEEIRDLIIFSIASDDYYVAPFATAESGYSDLQSAKPDLIVVDWMLPGMDGIDLTKNVRKSKKYKTMPIIMLTARGEEADRERAFEAGVDRYITKPFSPKFLREQIKELLTKVDKTSQAR
mgnify:FL=1